MYIIDNKFNNKSFLEWNIIRFGVRTNTGFTQLKPLVKGVIFEIRIDTPVIQEAIADNMKNVVIWMEGYQDGEYNFIWYPTMAAYCILAMNV